jgi:transcriptional regulator with XRE-family HTH domain
MNRSQQLREGRERVGLTQVQAAKRLRVSQPYLSLLESGKRAVTRRVARAAGKVYSLPPTVLPVAARPVRATPDASRAVRALAALGYPGYAHVKPGSPANPATVVLEALSERALDARVSQALPWVLARFPDLDWEWLLGQAKLRNLQNRLGFVVTLARQLAERDRSQPALERLEEAERRLEESRLVAETTLGRESMPQSERSWLRLNRPPEAQHWNVLTDLTADQVRHVP